MTTSVLETLLVIMIMTVLAMLGVGAWQHTSAELELGRARDLLKQYVHQVRMSAVNHKATRCLQIAPSEQLTRQYHQYLWITDVHGKQIQSLAWLSSSMIHWRSNLGFNQRLCFTQTGMTLGQNGYFMIDRFGQGSDEGVRQEDTKMHVNQSGEMW